MNITPQTKIGEMLEAYPQLMDTLLRLSPSFAKLKNPVLRKTIARVVSLRQAAEVGGIDVGTMVNELRKAAGLDQYSLSTDAEGSAQGKELLSVPKPDWLTDAAASQAFVLDVRDKIERGESPLAEILSSLNKLDTGEVLLLITPFVPVPAIELLSSKGYRSWSKKEEDIIHTFIK